MHKLGMVPTAAKRDGDARKNLRVQVQISAHLHAAGECQATVITDLSLDGVGLDGAIAIFIGDQVEIELINGRRIPGYVIWWLMGSCGIQFSTPLSEDDVIFTQEPQPSSSP